ncbi:caffeoylshikimate esterase-like [Salvia hispanica]|uniref:caffeoylshikimate esterase-like n=1 Tax=Salvia hispanica TaxID=49212 RepID=UPI0020090341|nr:caffeoylshikimate esterase-like [Salvia hispanica]
MECGNFMKGVGVELSNHGYAVFGIDYEGHGQSSGARCYIKRFDNIVNDCSEYFKSVCAREEYKRKRRFLYGESMGGAVALLIHKKDASFWDGAILVAPMCKISEKVKPHPITISLLTRVEDVIPKWKIVPTKDVIDSAFKDPVKREQIRGNKLIYQEKPRLKRAARPLGGAAEPEWAQQSAYLFLFFPKSTPNESRRCRSYGCLRTSHVGLWYAVLREVNAAMTATTGRTVT